MNDLRVDATDVVGPEGWVQAHADALYRFAMDRVGRHDVAEDLVQETLLAGFESRGRFRGQSQQRTWLIGILRHKVLDYFRRCSTMREQTIGGDQAPGDPLEALFDDRGRWRQPPAAWLPEQAAENREFWAVFERCLGRLSLRARSVFVLRVLDDRDAMEVCKELGISPTNFWVAMHRARAALRACLERTWFSGASARE